MSKASAPRLTARRAVPPCLWLPFLVPAAWPAAARDLPETPAAYLAQMDADGDGRVSLQEYLDAGLRAFDAMDADRDGVLAGAELPFADAAPVPRQRRADALRRAFLRQDRDGDGFLTVEELAAPPR